MPPKKRKQQDDDDASTDEEKCQQAKISKTGRIINPGAAKADAEKPKLKYDLEWAQHGQANSKNIKPLIYLWSKTLPGSDKVASFDIDHTIIKTKSGKKFATSKSYFILIFHVLKYKQIVHLDAADWVFFDKSIPPKLKKLNEEGYRILFITNQGGIEKGNVKFAELKTKFETIISELDIPVYVLIATGETHFRKPSTGMWDFFVENLNKSVKVNMDESFFVGDAAGRPKNWAPGQPKDFSCGDRMFAANIKLSMLLILAFFKE